MRKTWGLLLALIAVAVGLASQDVWAVKPGTLPPSQYPFETTIVNGADATTSFDSVGSFGAGRVIYGFRLIADTAVDSCALFDSATVGTFTENRTQGRFIDDIQQDTDERSVDSDWPGPYVLVTDLSVKTNGLCIIYHDPFS
jgi:hypothetical protein